MKRSPNLIDAYTMSEGWYNDCQTQFGKQWVPARPEGLWSFSNRCKLAWLVFTGRCDALRWPGQEF